MTDKTTNALQRLLSEFLAYTLLKRAKQFRRTQPRMAVYAHDFIGTEINVYGRYEDRELTALSEIIAGLGRSRLVLDVGANIGNHALFFASEGFENIHAFEPNPRTFNLLRLNAERYPQITVHAFGLSVEERVLEAAIPVTNAGGASLQDQHVDATATGVERTSFEVKRFDDLTLAAEPVGLVKIDVEGHEPEAIEGMRATLARDLPTVIFECNRKTERTSADRLVALLREIGYSRFTAVEPPASVMPQSLPGALRHPLRFLERLVSSRLATCETAPIKCFEERNYPMIVASPSANG